MALEHRVGSERSPHSEGDPYPSTRLRRGPTGIRPFLVASSTLLALWAFVPTACAGESEDTSNALSGMPLAFESLASTWEIVIADGEGNVRWLTSGPGLDSSPVWSPDGRTIAFERASAGDCFNRPCEIFVIDVDGGNERNLTSNPLNDESPTWSPDGQQIAFERDAQIHVMNADGSGQRRLAQSEDERRRNPAWSPDGATIAFERARGRGLDVEIYVMNVDGSGLRNLTRSEGYDTDPAWSPDGRIIAFASTRTGKAGIYVMEADGSSPRRLTATERFSDAHAWSPDGRKLVFQSGLEGDWDIYVVNSDGSGLRSLTDGPAYDDFPAWSSDGKQIVFTRDELLYVMKPDGSDARPLLENHPYWSRSPAFQPSP